MKKIITPLLFVATSITFSFGQSIHILNKNVDITNQIITVPIAKGNSTITELSLLNKTSKKVDYQVNRTILNAPMKEDSCTSLYFCTGIQCYAPNSETTWTPPDAGSSIDANATLPDTAGTYGIAAHYDMCPSDCNDLYVLYRVYKTTPGSNDTAYVTLKYTCSMGINEQKETLGSISDAYPNPANSSFSLNYRLKASSKSEIVLYDIVGKKVMENVLQKNEGVITINTSSLTA